MSRGKKIVIGGISACLLLWLADGTKSCRRAEGDKARIKPGVSVAEVFEVTDDWNLSSVYCNEMRNRGHFLAGHFSGTYSIATHEPEGEHTIGSRDELIEVVEKEMGQGCNWHISFTYMGVPRSTFRVDFDAQGKVKDVSDTFTGP